MRAFAAFAAAFTCSLALAWVASPAQLPLPPGAVSVVNEDHFGSRRALCVETGGTLVQREGSPRHVALAVLSFLDNDFLTGVCLPVDGGRTVYAAE